MATLLPSEKQTLLSKPAFYVRRAVVDDAPATASLHKLFQQHSLRATLNSPLPVSSVQKGIAKQELPNAVQLVAISTTDNSAPRKGLLGYIYILPFVDSTTGLEPKTCYDRTSSMYLITMEEKFLGTDLYHDVITTLIDTALSTSRDRHDRYKTVVTTTPFIEGRQELAAYCNILAEQGFKQVGVLKEVIEKDGLLLDQVYLQRAMK